MPWSANEAESHTRKATTWALQELWAKVANAAWNELATKAALSGKRTLWSRGGPKPVSSGVSGEIGEAAVDFMQSSAVTASCNQPDAIPRPATPAELDFGIIRGRQEPRCLGRQQNSYLSGEASTPYLPPRSSSTWTADQDHPRGNRR